jgi:tRNA-specific 2-thiouridylase
MKKVFVGLSGGVDSSVSAALLKEAGFDVYGVFIKVWQPDMALTGGCTWREDRLDAMRVCAKLSIPFYILDLEKKYKKEVVDYMIREYKAGRTPNPDVMCNKYVKFGGFFDWAMKNGADFVATGHYARACYPSEGKAKLSESTDIFLLKNSSCSRQSRSQASLKALPYLLLAGKDKNKDQSYFLWTLTQKQLAKTLFPVGDIEKPQVRKLAKKFGLLTAEKRDSQGLCFIGKVDIMDFLKNFIKEKPGNVINEKGEIIGTHDGVFFYTIGQRHGFVITKKQTTEKPCFIITKDLKANTIMVSHNPIIRKDISNNEIRLKNVNWIAGAEPDFRKEYSARIRYRQPLEKCHFMKSEEGGLIIKFSKPQKSPTPGQSAVFYEGEVCLGGGIIEDLNI